MTKILASLVIMPVCRLLVEQIKKKVTQNIWQRSDSKDHEQLDSGPFIYSVKPWMTPDKTRLL
jgi:hypothetical protein